MRTGTKRLLGSVLASLVGLSAFCASFSTTRALAQGAAATPDAAAVSADEAAIRQSVVDFESAFKRHDAQAVANLWTENGEYIDEVGQRYEGRAAIEQEYEQFFRDHPAAELQISVGSIRLLGPSTAIEDGSASLVPRPAGAPGGSNYVAVHVKQEDGRWLLASVRDSLVEVPSNYGSLQHLELLVGEWTAEHAGTRADVSCQWNPRKSFLERRFVVTRDGKVVSASTEMIGWDPIAKQVTSWTFSSDGGRAQGTWTELEDGWAILNEGVTADGTPTESVDVWAALLDGALGWRSTRRSIGGTALKDARHVVLKKKTPTASAAD